MRFTIQMHYATGNSFGSHDETDQLGISWTNLDRAKEALARIKENHEVTKEHESRWSYRNPGQTPRSLADTKGYSKEYPEIQIMLPLDDGTDHPHDIFWLGYFETLHEARIIMVDVPGPDESMVYRPD